MSNHRNEFQSLGSSPNPGERRARPAIPDPNDADLLDSYSQAVVNVVDTVTPGVLSITASQQSSGSGFLISADGYAITNSHVVGGQKRLRAETFDGDRVDASVVGDDPATDIAVLKLASSDLPYTQLGDSEACRVGQLVIAIGSPLGLHSTVSTGVVSSVGRAMRSQDGRLIENMVQHTAPINPGNSGGPLVDSRGRVIAVNTAIIAMAQGLGFAIPSNTTEWVVNEILSHGAVRRLQLGIAASVERLARSAVRDLDLLSDHVVHVVDVVPGGVAQRSHIQAGDLIVAINDRITSSVDDVHRLLSQLQGQAHVDVSIIRGDSKFDVRVEWD